MEAKKLIGICILLGTLLVVAIIAVLVVVLVGTQKTADFDSTISPLEFFNINDALKIKWYHGANNKKQMQEAIQGDYKMIEADIILRWRGLPNQTDEPVMADPPEVDSDNTLDNWLNTLLNVKEKGLKLDFKSIDVVRPSLQLLASKKNNVRCPVWANADIVAGPKGKQSGVIDSKRFFNLVNELYPKMTLSVGWTTGCCNVSFSRDMMKSMLDKCIGVNQPLTFPARAKLLKASWPEFKWLLNQTTVSSSITVWTPAGRNDWEDTDIYDLLYVRNDIHKRYIYYDLPGPRFTLFQRLSVTAGSPLNHFNLSRERDALEITWAHGVNSQKSLTDTLTGNLMFLEADILLRGQGTANQTDIPVMAHPPSTDSDITLEQWIQRVVKTNRGIKLDFKSVEVLKPAMKILNDNKSSFNQPVWLNADIFKGPNSNKPGVNRTEFRRIILENFPESTLSIGWTTGWNSSKGAVNEVYNKNMTQEMALFCRDLKQPVTFPIRAAMAKRSWDLLTALLAESRAYTITIWSGKKDNVDPDDMVYIRQNSEPERVYYDLPEPLMNEFKKRIGLQS